jgi:hypothetical protein
VKKGSNGAVDAHNGGKEAQNGAMEGLSVGQWSQTRITMMKIRIRLRIWNRIEQSHPDLHLSEKKDPDPH